MALVSYVGVGAFGRRLGGVPRNGRRGYGSLQARVALTVCLWQAIANG